MGYRSEVVLVVGKEVMPQFLGIGLLMAGCMYAFGMYKYLEYKKNEAYRVQILNYEMKRFMDQAIYDFNKSKG